MFKLLKKANVIPKSLFITDVKIDMEQGTVNVGGFGRVFLGEYKGDLVALKLLGKGLKDVSIALFPPHHTDSFVKGKFSQEFVLEVLARRSLSHPFVLPLLGIFVDRSLPYFVSPHMKISLTEWRRTHTPTVPEINRLVRLQRLPPESNRSIMDQVQEVAVGVRYIHEEGIVHGDLRGVRILTSHIDHEFTYWPTRKMSSSMLNTTAELLLMLVYLNKIMPLLRYPPMLFCLILLRRNCLLTSKILKLRLEVRRRRRTCMLLVAFTMQYVPCVPRHINALTRIDLYRYSLIPFLSRGKMNMESHPGMLENRSF